MTVQTSLQKLRPIWVEKVSRELTTGDDMRLSFEEQLQRFYTLLEQTYLTGDLAWLDSALYDWGHSSTQSNLEEADYQASFVVDRIISLTINVVNEQLDDKDALELLAAIIPILTHSLSVVIRYEMEARVARISYELGAAQEKLEILDRNKSKFISVAAHELKTPLTLVEGYASMMADLVQGAEQAVMKKYLTGVENGIARLHSIINDMLDVSLIDNHLLKLNIQPMWVSHLLGLLENEFKKPIAERRQTLEVRAFEGSDAQIYGDSERVFQALSNIIFNAIKFTPDHGKIIVDGRLLPGFIEITVTDSGIGISAEDQTLIFNKFGQLGSTDLHSSGKTKFKGGGPGLGLSIARGIVEAHGGVLWVESEGYDEVKLAGSIFHILLPAGDDLRSAAAENMLNKDTFKKSETESNGEENSPTDNPAA
ncbi:MAG: HAMP domain-containing histidine kinase [Anaerolineales bacterium]|nr:HAMP domain-containing histidine kinase [Anaerolineales bacterium]